MTSIASFKASENCFISIVADGVVTQAALDKLIALINLIKDSFPELELNRTP